MKSKYYGQTRYKSIRLVYYSYPGIPGITLMVKFDSSHDANLSSNLIIKIIPGSPQGNYDRLTKATIYLQKEI